MNNFNIKFLKDFKKPHGKIREVGYRLSSDIRRVGLEVFVIKSIAYGKITSNQIEAARRAIRKVTKKAGKVIIRIYPYLPLTKKPAEVRMGKGKGSKIRAWVYPVKPGKDLFEVSGVSTTVGKISLKKAVEKLGVRCKILNLREF